MMWSFTGLQRLAPPYRPAERRRLPLGPQKAAPFIIQNLEIATTRRIASQRDEWAEWREEAGRPHAG